MHLSKNIFDNATFLFAKIRNCLTLLNFHWHGAGVHGDPCQLPRLIGKQSPNKHGFSDTDDDDTV